MGGATAVGGRSCRLSAIRRVYASRPGASSHAGARRLPLQRCASATGDMAPQKPCIKREGEAYEPFRKTCALRRAPHPAPYGVRGGRRALSLILAVSQPRLATADPKGVI